MADLVLNSRSDEDVPPLAPVHLPEFGQSVSWLMCRNPMCTSFGIPIAVPSIQAFLPGNWSLSRRVKIEKLH